RRAQALHPAFVRQVAERVVYLSAVDLPPWPEQFAEELCDLVAVARPSLDQPQDRISSVWHHTRAESLSPACRDNTTWSKNLNLGRSEERRVGKECRSRWS